ncbi:MAG TPA: metallophosphoesterase family protein [Thermoleophilaceae bacterium]|nr:metallophosphoesterase family protein [Thermoleophilaceae bacterium]
MRKLLLAIISDTHMPEGARQLPERCVELLGKADLIVHAGDINTTAVLAQLRSLGPPVVAVHGNVDSAELRRELPATATIDCGEVEIAVIHDAGRAHRRLERMRKRFPSAAAVVFGHSHIPLHEKAADFQIFNPGSPTERRRAPTHTMGLARIEHDRVEFEHVTLS